MLDWSSLVSLKYRGHAWGGQSFLEQILFYTWSLYSCKCIISSFIQGSMSTKTRFVIYFKFITWDDIVTNLISKITTIVYLSITSVTDIFQRNWKYEHCIDFYQTMLQYVSIESRCFLSLSVCQHYKLDISYWLYWEHNLEGKSDVTLIQYPP